MRYRGSGGDETFSRGAKNRGLSLFLIYTWDYVTGQINHQKARARFIYHLIFGAVISEWLRSTSIG